ncbi:MAG TPA: hypothetical protein VFY78_03655 [Gammaproteobacteria bacterium]|nr:hypothetical protein [Gammaproteobacteria bacterium]
MNVVEELVERGVTHHFDGLRCAPPILQNVTCGSGPCPRPALKGMENEKYFVFISVHLRLFAHLFFVCPVAGMARSYNGLPLKK